MKADLEGSPDQVLEELEKLLRSDPNMTEKQIQEVIGQMSSTITQVLEEAKLRPDEEGTLPQRENTQSLEQAVHRLHELIDYNGLEEEELALEIEEKEEKHAEGIHELMAILTDEERALLHLLASQGWEMDRDALCSALPGIDVDAIIQVRINKKAIDSIQDVLIATGGGRRIVCDPYREAISEEFASAP